MWHEYYPKSRPQKVAGGIKSQSKSGDIGKTWWAKRWVAVLEGFDIASRLTRGRAYARSGQVLNIDTESGKVTAKVQGSRPIPYAVSIEVRRLAAKRLGQAHHGIEHASGVRGEVARRGNAPRHRVRVRAGGAVAVSEIACGDDHGLFVPGLVEPVQACGGCLLSDW